MHLAQYLAETGTKQKDLAALLGITLTHMSRIVTRRSLPSTELAEKIEAATSGQVDFKTMMTAERAAPKKAAA